MEKKYTIMVDFDELSYLKEILEEHGSEYLTAFEDNGAEPDGNILFPQFFLDFTDDGVKEAIDVGIGEMVYAEFWEPGEWLAGFIDDEDDQKYFDEMGESEKVDFIKDTIQSPYWTLYADVLVVCNDI